MDNVDNSVYNLIFRRKEGKQAGDKFCGQVWRAKVDKWITGGLGEKKGCFFVQSADRGERYRRTAESFATFY